MRGRCFYTLQELSEITGVMESELQHEIDTNKLKTDKLKNKFKISLYDLKKYLSPDMYDDFFNNTYLSEEKLFNIAGIDQNYWEHTLLLQCPDWNYVLIFIKKPDEIGEMVKVGFNPINVIERNTISSDKFISLLQSNQFTSISKYEDYKSSEDS
ncbi:hypothetical protein ACFL6H_06720 [Candidatus Latescibacterota bacterium]